MKHLFILLTFLTLAMSAHMTVAAKDESRQSRKEKRELRTKGDKKYQKNKNQEQEAEKNDFNNDEQEIVLTEPEMTETVSESAVVNPIAEKETPSVAPVMKNSEQIAVNDNDKAQSVTAVNHYEHKSDTSDADAVKIIVYFLLAVLLFRIIRWIFSGRCRKCGKFKSMREIDVEDLGIIKSERKKDNKDGAIYYIHHHRYGVTRRCKKCGYEDYITKIVKES